MRNTLVRQDQPGTKITIRRLEKTTGSAPTPPSHGTSN